MAKALLLLLLLSGFSRVRLCATPQTAAHRAPASMGFSQARVLEWGATAFSESPPTDRQPPQRHDNSQEGHHLLSIYRVLGSEAG